MNASFHNVGDEPLFSVVIPTYNRAGVVVQAVQSVLSQSIQDFEILLVDDGSTDHTLDVLDDIEDSRLKIITQPNAGASAARNNGIRAAKGRYIAFLDSDDYYYPDHLEVAFRSLKDDDDENTIVYGQVIVDRGAFQTFLRPSRALRTGELVADYLLRHRGSVLTTSLAMSARMAKQTLYREDVTYGDDVDFAIRLQLAGGTFRMSEKPTSVYRDVPSVYRLSQMRAPPPAAWLEDLKEVIPARAYYAYRGWHEAKMLWPTQPCLALSLYLKALTAGAFGPSLALIALLQIIVAPQRLRSWSNKVLSITRTSSKLRLLRISGSSH